ncbi:hypothetical protein LTR08_008403 [Meristemomyces frigidus]|nr:hypothetical protein LTR08_008403 [Meristemomyces frigidus]
MASADPIVLQSSSPQLPSPSTFLRPLTSGSRAQQPPPGTTSGFASAAVVWRSHQQEEEKRGVAETEEVEATETAKAKAKEEKEKAKETKARAKDGPGAKGSSGVRRPARVVRPPPGPGESAVGAGGGTAAGFGAETAHSRRGSSISLSEFALAAPVAEETPIRAPPPAKKPRKRSAAAPKAQDGTEKKPVRKRRPKSEAIIINSDEAEQSTYFSVTKPAGNLPSGSALPPPALDAAESPAPASKRRLSWTPVKDTVTYALPADSAPSAAPSPAARRPLSELLGNFSYAASELATSPPPDRATSGEAMTKRRRIHITDATTVSALPRKSTTKTPIVTTMLPPPPKAAKRAKSPKKKAQTITALATAAYQTVKEADSAQSTVSEFFEPRKQDVCTTDAASEEIAETVKVKKPRKPRVKKNEDPNAPPAAAKKPAKPRKAAKLKEAPQRPPLYSPEKAVAQMHQQAFLFGTSSQLAADESAAFIQDVQLAIRESEMTLGTQASPTKKSSSRVPTAPHGTCLSVEQAGKELWCSAARDSKGGLLREKSGLGGRSRVQKSIPAPRTEDAPMFQPTTAVKEVELAGIAQPTTDQPPVSAQAIELVIEAPQQRASKPKNAGAHVSADGLGDFHDIDEMPQQQLPKKRRKPKTPETDDKNDSFLDIDEISDPETPPTPSPPRRRASASPSTLRPLPLEIRGSPSPRYAAAITTALPSTGAALKATDSQWLTVSTALFPAITAIVKASPRSIDPTNPSWHQKILMYDPIVLEDFTAYLLVQGLRITVQRTRRKPAARKGGKKKDADALAAGDVVPEVETGAEELQAWMVQKWCEEMSVCCLWREGMRGGVRARY